MIWIWLNWIQLLVKLLVNAYPKLHTSTGNGQKLAIMIGISVSPANEQKQQVVMANKIWPASYQ